MPFAEGVKVTGFYAEKDEERREKGVVGAGTVEVSRSGDIVVERRYESGGEWKSAKLATVLGPCTVRARFTVRTGAKGDWVQSDVVLTFDEKDMILVQASKLYTREPVQPKHLFNPSTQGYAGEPGEGRPVPRR